MKEDENFEFNAEDFYEIFLNNEFNFMEESGIQYVLLCLSYFKDQISIAQTTNLVDSVEVTIKITKDTGGNKSLEQVSPIVTPLEN